MHTLKQNLTYAYQIIAMWGLDDHTYTHLSARLPGEESFYIYPFGLRFEEVTPQMLLKVSFEGEVLEGREAHYNKTGYVIHAAIYKSRPDLRAIFHLHTPATVAVSALKKGLLPLSQWALHFYGQVGYHAYDSLALNVSQGNQMVKDLGEKKVLFLENHGVLTCGHTLHEALFYTYHLEQACKTQLLIQSAHEKPIIPSPKVCEKAVTDLLSFEKDLGMRDWEAWVRKLSRNKLKV